MDRQGFQRIQEARTLLNEQLHTVEYLEALMDDYDTLVKRATDASGQLDIYRLSEEGQNALDFITTYLNALEGAACRGAERAFWTVGDGQFLEMRIPELADRSLGEVTADLLEVQTTSDFVTMIRDIETTPMGTSNQYLVAEYAIPAWRVLAARFGGEAPLELVE